MNFCNHLLLLLEVVLIKVTGNWKCHLYPSASGSVSFHAISACLDFAKSSWTIIDVIWLLVLLAYETSFPFADMVDDRCIVPQLDSLIELVCVHGVCVWYQVAWTNDRPNVIAVFVEKFSASSISIVVVVVKPTFVWFTQNWNLAVSA